HTHSGHTAVRVEVPICLRPIFLSAAFPSVLVSFSPWWRSRPTKKTPPLAPGGCDGALAKKGHRGLHLVVGGPQGRRAQPAAVLLHGAEGGDQRGPGAPRLHCRQGRGRLPERQPPLHEVHAYRRVLLRPDRLRLPKLRGVRRRGSADRGWHGHARDLRLEAGHDRHHVPDHRHTRGRPPQPRRQRPTVRYHLRRGGQAHPHRHRACGVLMWWFSGSFLRDGSAMRCGYTVDVALLPAALPLCVPFFSFFWA
ncbi:unnamed protein product, partial [Ectocarpus sp. 12 AP-2014]